LFRLSTITSKRFERRAKITKIQLLSYLKKIAPVALIVVIVMGLNSLLVVKKINCSLNDQVCPVEIITIMNRSLGKNSLFINQKGLINQVKNAYPIDKVSIGFTLPNTLLVKLQGTRPFIQANIYLVQELPKLSMDEAPSTTDSASWWTRPSVELQKYLDSKEGLGFNLWDNGTMTPVASVGANISYIFTQKPDSEEIASIFDLIKLASKYLNLSQVYIINNRCFLSPVDQPDIIVTVPFDEGSVTTALQSLNYLVTIKKDTKVIDLSFKNPILR